MIMQARRLKMSVKEIIEKIDALEDKIDVKCIAEKIAMLNKSISVSTTAKVSENEIYDLYLHARAAMFTSNAIERAKLYEKLKKTKIELLRELAKRVELDLKKHEILREKCEFCRKSHQKRIKVLVEGGIIYEEILPICERKIRLHGREALEYAKIVVKKAKSIELAKIAISKANKRIGREESFEAVIGYKYLREFDCYMRVITKASECYIPAEFDVCVDVDDADVKAVDIFIEDIVADENFEKIWLSEKHGTEEHEIFA